MVRAGLGVTAMARWAAEPYLQRGGLTAVPVTASGVRRRWYAATRAGAEPAYVRAFVEALRVHGPQVGVVGGDGLSGIPPLADSLTGVPR